MFLRFANLYRSFIKNFNKITIVFNSLFWIVNELTDIKSSNISVNENMKNKDILYNTNRIDNRDIGKLLRIYQLL